MSTTAVYSIFAQTGAALPNGEPWWSSAVLIGVVIAIFGYWQIGQNKRLEESQAAAKEERDERIARDKEHREQLDKALSGMQSLTQTIGTLSSAMSQVASEVQKSNQNVDAMLRALLGPREGGR